MTDMVSPFQSKGNFGARDFHLHVWNIPIPEFNANNPLHTELSDMGREGVRKVNAFQLDPNSDFKKLRTAVRDHLQSSGFFAESDELVKKLLNT
jgi:hypothetical protein